MSGRQQPTDDERQQILTYFLAGNGVNHVVFLMGFDEHYPGGYRFNTDDVNAVIRQALSSKELRK